MGVNSLVHKVLTEVGIRPERFSLKWASAAEAPRFVKLITEFTGQVKKLGPIGEAEGISPDELKARLNTALNLVTNRKVRVGFGNATKTIRKEGKFTQEQINEVIGEKLGSTIAAGLIEENLLAALTKTPASLNSLVKQVGGETEQVEKLLGALSKQGKVEQQGDKWARAIA